jgi:hypothetical protein
MIFYIIAALMVGWAVFYLVRSVKKKDCGCGRTDCAYKDRCGKCRANEKP